MRVFSWAICLALLLSSCTTVNVGKDLAADGSKPSAAAAAASSSSSSKKKDPPYKNAKEVLKDTRKVDGFITMNVKRDRTVYATLPPAMLDKDFGLVMHFSSGNGTFNIQEGLYVSDTRLMRFERVADKIHLVHRNTRFVADDGSAMERALSNNVGHSIIHTFDIAAQDTASNAFVIDMTDFLVSDYADISDGTKFYFQNSRPAQFNKGSSWVDRVQGFPRNMEIDAMLTFKATAPVQIGSAGMADNRSFTAGLRYSFFALPDEPMRPRVADNRLGYFIDASKDFSQDKAYDPVVRHINRWRLEKKDPEAERSEPVTPITFYIDDSVPEAYRPYVKAGVEAWNKAYDEAGFINAIRAVDPPADDTTWSAEDIRYSTIRWTAAYQMGYAIGPSQTDPRSGEILNADILLSSEFVSGWSEDYAELIGPEGMLTRMEEAERMLYEAPAEVASRMCFYSMGLKQDMGLLQATVLADGLVGEVPVEVIGGQLKTLTMHEVGHTLGLMHNFESSQAIPFERLHDEEFTKKNGVTSSVMDYDRENINPDREEQGHYSNPEVGAYDVWVIQYGYTPFDADEEAEQLAAMAARSSEPLLTYGSHEDLAAGGIDPYINVWDLSDDHMAFAQSRFELIEDLEPRMEARLVGEGDYYDRLRAAYNGLLSERYGVLTPVTKLVGGVYFSRDHKGTPDARMPMTPVPAAEQEAAVVFIIDSFLAEGAISPSAEQLNKMPRSMHLDWMNFSGAPLDVQIHSTVAAMQATHLARLTEARKLTRMVDNEVRMPNGADAYTVAELFEDLTEGIWGEVESGSNISSIRRNLQRAYVDQMGVVMMNSKPSSAWPDWPEDARSLARLELVELSADISKVLAAGSVDRPTKAHLLESHARIQKYLDQGLTREVN